jgi:hypothetical protein
LGDLEVRGAHGLVMGWRVVLGEIVAKVFSARFPINEKMVLANADAHSIETHAHCMRTPLADKKVDHAVGGGIVGLYGRWWLGGMAHFDESGAENFSGLAVDVEGANFSFSGGGHDVAEDAAFGMDTAIVGWLPTGSFGRIGRTGTKKVMAAGAAARFWH